jgi:imidazolonepropionase-like amidohydrolase
MKRLALAALPGPLAAALAVALGLGLVLGACAGTAPTAPAPATAAAAPELAITGVTVIDGTGGPARADMTVVIRGDRIASIEPRAAAQVTPGARIVDGRSRFLVPGLWDMHVHLSKTRAHSLALLVAHGVTSVRDMGGDLDELLRWRAEIAAGARIGPRITMAGPFLESAANVERMRREGTVEPVARTRVPIADAADATRAVDRLAARGVDFIKFRTVASPEAYRAIAEAARAHGLPLAGHADQVPIDDMIAAGQRTLDHHVPLARKTADERAAIYRRLVERGIGVVPTMVTAFDSLLVPLDQARAIVEGAHPDPDRALVAAYTLADWREQLAERPPGLAAVIRGLLADGLRTLREMHRAGVAIAPGTDSAVLLIYPGTSLHRELALLVSEVGMTPMEILVAATRRSAELAGQAREVGTIERGKRADLVMLDADPLADVAHLARIHAVVLAGRLLARAALDDVLAQARAAPELTRNDWK